MTLSWTTFSSSLSSSLLLAAMTAGGAAELEHLSTFELAPGTTFEETCVGGLSALEHDAEAERTYALSDSGTDARFYELSIGLDREAGAITGVEIERVVRLHTREGVPYPPRSVDPEGFRLAGDGRAYVSSEGFAPAGIPPFVDLVDAGSGRWLATAPVPAFYAPPAPGAPEPREPRGVRRNLGFESLALAPGDDDLYAATESALAQDLPAEVQPGETVYGRLLHYKLEKAPRLFAEYLYPLTEPEGDVVVHGLVELLGLPGDRRLLALERTYVRDRGFAVRLFEVDLRRSFMEMAGAGLSASARGLAIVWKEELADLAELGVALENYEGMTFGPPLADGSRSLLLVSDNDDVACTPGHDRPTRFVLLRYSPPATGGR